MQNICQRFGFPAQNIVHAESLALGSASFTPMQVARGYAVMANGGFLVDPWFISKIEKRSGRHNRSETESSLPGMRYSGDLR
ncbi:penicillin-binding transpeptidase domain-containing protein [Escherichia coli]